MNMHCIFALNFLHTLRTRCLCYVWCRFPNPPGYVVKEEILFSHMGKILRSKRGDIVKAIKKNYKKPSWCTMALWEEGKVWYPQNEKKWSQQREARRVQMASQGTHKLGSGGRARFKAFFVSTLRHTA